MGREPPSAAEAALLLSTTGAAPHVEAGTCGTLAQAAVRAPADDAAAAELAAKLLEQFRAELPEPLRPSLLLLELARNLRAGTAGPGWVRMALDLRSLDPEPGPRDHAYAAVARRLLGDDRTEGDLRALIESNDVELLAAYRRLARDPAVLETAAALLAPAGGLFHRLVLPAAGGPGLAGGPYGPARPGAAARRAGAGSRRSRRRSRMS